MGLELTIPDIPHYSYKDYELWEGDWELINGIPYSLLPWPNWKHQDVGGNFMYTFQKALDTHNTDCKIIHSCIG